MAWKAVVTNAGAALLASYAEGGHELLVDRATVAAGTMDEINMRVATALTDEKCNASIINKQTVTQGTKFKVQVGPATAAVGAYTAHQIGLWATLDSGLQTLLALAQDSAGGVGVPLQSVSPNFAFALYITIAVSNTGDITIIVDDGAIVTVSTLHEAIAEALEDVLTTGDVANDLTTTEAGMVLDARQGKALNEAISLKADASNVYTKSQIDGALEVIDETLNAKANASDVYTQQEIDAALEEKADADDVYTKTEVDAALGEKPSRHVFNATVPVTGWEAYQSALYRVTVNVPGMLATDACGGASPVQTGTETDDKAIRKAWGRVTRIVAGADSITVYASKIPESAIPLQIEVFR